MAAVTTDKVSHIAELSDGAFGAFCEDIGGMFGVEMRCERRAMHTMTAAGLRTHFDKLTAVHVVKARGGLDGTFHLVFDQGGLFVLAGAVVMLPESCIRENIEQGTLEQAVNLQDAVREVGNLLVGSWDRVFRAEDPDHGHFTKTGTFLGKPWKKPQQIELQAEARVVAILYEMTLDGYPGFTCAAVFPAAVLDGAARAATSQPTQTQSGAGPVAAPKSQTGASAGGSVVPQSLTEANRVIPSAKTTLAMLDEILRSEPAPAPARGHAGGGLSFLDNAHVRSRTQMSLAELLHLPVAEIMEKEVVWAAPDETVQDVIARMRQHDAGYVLVGANGNLEGLLSASNIHGAVSLYLRPMFAKWRTAQDDATLRVRVKWIMSRPVRAVPPDATVGDVIEGMCRSGGRCLPVVDMKGAVLGIVTAFDILLRTLGSDGSVALKGKPPQAPSFMT